MSCEFLALREKKKTGCWAIVDMMLYFVVIFDGRFTKVLSIIIINYGQKKGPSW